MGGLAGGGSLSQSAVNEGAGARSEVSPLIAAVLILITVLVLTPLFKNLPEAVLAALIIHAVSHLWKVAEMRRYYNLQRLEFWLALATLLGVITIDVLPGLVIGVGAMLLLVIYHASRPQIGSLGRVPGRARRLRRRRPASGLRAHPGRARAPARGAAVLRQRDAGSRPHQDARRRERPAPAALILDIGANERLDITSAEMLTELVAHHALSGCRRGSRRRPAACDQHGAARPGLPDWSGRTGSFTRSTKPSRRWPVNPVPCQDASQRVSGGTLMGQAIGQVLSFGVGVALSPVPIIAVVLMLATPRAG